MSAQAHNQHAAREHSDAIENYAKAIYALQEHSHDAVASITELAERLGVGTASVSGMVRRLSDLGLVEHTPYRGVTLTEEGERVALGVIRSHRLLELFLTEVLEVPWDRVHAEAEVLEHHISPELEELIARKLGDPTADPHGDPIPSRDLEIELPDTVALAALEAGQRGSIARISDAQPDLLRYLADRDIGPGDAIEVLEREPFDGPITVRVGDAVHTVGGQVGRVVRIRTS